MGSSLSLSLDWNLHRELSNAKLIAELFVLQVNFWMIPTIYPYEEEQEVWQKLDIIKGVCTAMGLPIFDERKYCVKQRRKAIIYS